MWTIIAVLLAVGSTICVIFREYSECVNRVPDGKKFVKKFITKTKAIQEALEYDKIDIIDCHVPDPNKQEVRLFSVAVKDDKTPNGLEYETIQKYKSKCVYINNEPVCRIHILHIACTDKCYLEFSRKRDIKEVIEIIECAFKVASTINREHYNALLSYSSKSFYQ